MYLWAERGQELRQGQPPTKGSKMWPRPWELACLVFCWGRVFLFCFVFSSFMSYRNELDWHMRAEVPGQSQASRVRLLLAPARHHSHPTGMQAKPLRGGGKGRASRAWRAREMICKPALGASSKYFLCEYMQISLWGSPLSGLVLHRLGFLPGVEQGLRKALPKGVASVCSYTAGKAVSA